MGPAIAVIGAVASVVGTVASIGASRRAAAEQRKQTALVARRERRSAIRGMQIKRAQALASAGAVGAGTGSGAIGGIGALTSQLGSNIGFGTQMSALSNLITKHQQQASTFAGIAGLGQGLYRMGGSPTLGEMWDTVRGA